MAWHPRAVRKEIPRYRTPMAAYNRVNLHVAVSEAASLHGFFSGAGVCSHFYVRKDGTIEQYVDTRFRAAADLEGNDATISVETQGGLVNAQGEPWTAAQVAALADIYGWAIREHGIAARIARDSRPGVTSRGLSWHRLGVDPWRVSGGMKYSNSRGKVCPGDAKIAQIPGIFQAAAGGAAHVDAPIATPGTVSTVPGAAPLAPLTPEDDMFSDTDRALLQNVENLLARERSGGIRGDVLALRTALDTQAKVVTAIVQNVENILAREGSGGMRGDLIAIRDSLAGLTPGSTATGPTPAQVADELGRRLTQGA